MSTSFCSSSCIHLPLLRPLPEEARKDILEVDIHLLDAAVGDDLEGRKTSLLHFDLDGAVVQLTVPQLPSQFFPRALPLLHGLLPVFDVRVPGGRRGRQQEIQNPLLRVRLGLFGHLLELLVANHFDRDLDEIPDHGLHVASHVSDFGKLGRLDLEERRVGQPGQPSRDLGLSDSGRPDHDDVLRHHLVGHIGRELLAPDTVSQRNRHRALGGRLADDVPIQLPDRLTRGQVFEMGRHNGIESKHVEVRQCQWS
jgi:hypothetical protein